MLSSWFPGDLPCRMMNARIGRSRNLIRFGECPAGEWTNSAFRPGFFSLSFPGIIQDLVLIVVHFQQSCYYAEDIPPSSAGGTGGVNRC